MKFITKEPIKFTADEITAAGAEVELTPAQAKPLLAAGAIEPAKPGKPAKNEE